MRSLTNFFPRFSRFSSQIRSFSSRSFDPNPSSEGAHVGEVILVTKRGVDILNDPLFNKGSGFPAEERERLGVRGLVPPRSFDIQRQKERVLIRYNKLDSSLAKYQYLADLQDRNETLYYRVLIDNLEDMAPIIYTPTVGEACQKFGNLFKRPRGMYFSSDDIGNMHSMVYNWPEDDVHIIVVTDGSRILGLGDLGANGMGIPIGKLALYTAGAGIHPSRCLPVQIDVGTNNEAILSDTMYLGLRQHRLRGEQYMAVIREFVEAVQERWPRCLIQFEDFSNENAYRLLEHYRNKVLCFNDDIQGTGTVALAATLSSLRAIGQMSQDALTNQRIVICGAGSAGLGVAKNLAFAMRRQGLQKEQTRERFWIVDEHGLLGHGRKTLQPNQVSWVRHDCDDKMSLLQVIEHVKPTMIFGLTGVGGLFTEPVIREMAKHVERPILFPLSNPTDKAECTAEQAYEWTDGRCIFGSGSPFKPVNYKGTTLYPSQANNMYAFPGIGLGTTAIKARQINDNMLYAAALALAQSVKAEDLNEGKLFPRLRDIRSVSMSIAIAVANQAFRDGLARVQHPGTGDIGLQHLIAQHVWEPKYGKMVWVSEIPSLQLA